jgi:hypothetical protein
VTGRKELEEDEWQHSSKGKEEWEAFSGRFITSKASYKTKEQCKIIYVYSKTSPNQGLIKDTTLGIFHSDEKFPF